MKVQFGYVLIVVATIGALLMTRKNYVATTNEPGTVTIRVGHFTLDPSFRRFLDKAGAAYEELHPHVKIKQMDVPRQVYPQWQRTQIIGDMAPEIMQFAYFNTGVEDMVMHRFTVLDSWVEKPNPYRKGTDTDQMAWRDTFLDGLNSRDAYNEKLRAYFGIPLIMGGYRFFYNEQLSAERLGSEDEWDFQEFKSLVERLNDPKVAAGDQRPVMPMATSNYSAYSWFKMLFGSMTQSLLFSLDRNYDLQLTGRDSALGYLEGRWNYHSEEVQAGLRLMREAGELMNPGFLQLQKPDGIMEFAQNRALGVGGAHIDLTYLDELAPFKVGEASFPVPDKNDPVYGRYVMGPVTEMSGMSSLTLGVLRSPLQEQAVDFLQFLTGSEMMALLRQETGWRISVQERNDDSKFDLKPGYPDGIYDIINTRSTLMAYRQNADRLFRKDGGVDEFAEVMDEEAPDEIPVWIKSQTTTLRRTLRQQEMSIVASWALSLAEEGDDSKKASLDGFLEVNNRQEAEYRGILRFMRGHEESL